MFGKVSNFPGARAFPINPGSLGQRGLQQPIQFVIGGPDYQTLRDWRDRVLAKAQATGLFVNLDSDYKENQPDLRVQIDRARAADLGVSIEDIGKTLELMFGEKQVSSFAIEGRGILRHRARPRRRTGRRRATSRTSSCARPAATSCRSRPSSRLRETAAPQKLNRFDRLRVDHHPGLARARRVDRPGPRDAGADRPRRAAAGGAHRLQGQSKEFKDASSAIYVTFGLALIVVFLVLAGAVRELDQPAHRHADGAARRHRRAAGALAHRAVAQHLQPDRHDPADRADDQERHPDRRVREPAARARPQDPRRGDRSPRCSACARS